MSFSLPNGRALPKNKAIRPSRTLRLVRCWPTLERCEFNVIEVFDRASEFDSDRLTQVHLAPQIIPKFFGTAVTKDARMAARLAAAEGRARRKKSDQYGCDDMSRWRTGNIDVANKHVKLVAREVANVSNGVID